MHEHRLLTLTLPPSHPPSLPQELVLKTHDNPHEFLGMLGGFGFLLASLQALFVEWGREGGRKGEEKEWEEGLGYMFGFALTLATMYTLTAKFLREVSAAERGGEEGRKGRRGGWKGREGWEGREGLKASRDYEVFDEDLMLYQA